jgi:fatty acid desaturase
MLSLSAHTATHLWLLAVNWHTEHHMYAAVPCYNLEILHNAIRYDLPPTPNGIVATWGVIAREMRLLRSNPLHFQRLEIPGANAGAGVNYRASSVSK